jgi:hypothetical protein
MVDDPENSTRDIEVGFSEWEKECGVLSDGYGDVLDVINKASGIAFGGCEVKLTSRFIAWLLNGVSWSKRSA